MSDFKRGDLVWAKVRGYSWWPAKIGEVLRDAQRGEKKYRVDFLGDNTHQTLPGDKVVDFAEHFARNANTKKRDLLDSIELAKKTMRKDELAALERRLAKGGAAAAKEAKKEVSAEKVSKMGAKKKAPP